MLREYIRQARKLPPHIIVSKAVRLASRLTREQWRKSRDLHRQTYANVAPDRLARLIKLSAKDIPEDLAAVLPAICKRYRAHQFDLLGSGWVGVHYGLDAKGVEGYRYPPGPAIEADADGDWLGHVTTPANWTESRRIWRLIDTPYTPIDWHVDFKTGHRWDSCKHFRDLRYGDVPGADVKIPWELARLQHLPQLATAHLLAQAGQSEFEAPDIYAQEVRCQIIDFLAANPPRFGVNWLCPMDVAIRVANMLLAVDLLRAGGWEPDKPFEVVVARAAAEHARYVLEHLEWSTQPRSNHYLSDIAGVLFCAAYLPQGDETDAWLAFTAHQIGIEIDLQFLVDGGNFEGSTNYHRLSTEIALFCVALLLGVSESRADAFAQPLTGRLSVRPPLPSGAVLMNRSIDGRLMPLPAAAIFKISRAVSTASCWLKPNGCAPQIGDNDSGRLFKLHPMIRRADDGTIHEDLLDHRHLLAAGAGLFADNASIKFADESRWFDSVVIAELAGSRKLSAPPSDKAAPMFVDDDARLREAEAAVRALPTVQRRVYEFLALGFRPGGLRRYRLDHFGLYVFRDDASYLSLRCFVPSGSHGMGHTHDDNLTLEFHHDGRDLIVDPGSLLYTPEPMIRDRYRMASAHFAPRPAAGPPATSAPSLFELIHHAWGECLYFGVHGMAATLHGSGWRTMRVVLLEQDRVIILDGCDIGPLAPDHTSDGSIFVSEGYGRRSDRLVRIL